jgi:hypothetical protein
MLPTQQLLIKRSVPGVSKSLLYYVNTEDKLLRRISVLIISVLHNNLHCINTLRVILYWQHVSVALCDHHQANLTQCMPSMRVQYGIPYVYKQFC